MQDVPQIEAFSIPIHVELTELMELHFDFVLNCDWGHVTSVCLNIDFVKESLTLQWITRKRDVVM